MIEKCRVRIARAEFDSVYGHLFPGDGDEHGAILLAGASLSSGQLNLLVREVHLARWGVDYVEGQIGYRALTPTFIHRLITRARDERLAYLAVHNHDASRSVSFSRVDLESHERGYPALLQITRGMPVGGLVFGRESINGDVWLPDGSRLELDDAVVVGNTMLRLTSSPTKDQHFAPIYDRQIKMFGKLGQAELANCRVAVLGLGGIGSLVVEYLARLGVGYFLLVDDDLVEDSNLSRIVGASLEDAHSGVTKANVAQRIILQANDHAQINVIVDDIAKESVAKEVTGCDYVFLAADSMRARLVFNAIVHQYLVPGVQLGSKVRSGFDGTIIDVISVNRPVRPGQGCLWCNQLIDTNALAKEAKTDDERRSQAYGVGEANPSVISLNAVSAAHAVNDFLLDYLCLRRETDPLHYEHFHPLRHTRSLVQPRRDPECSECSQTGRRYARGDSVELPCIEG
jgi:hypothetical protein